jgi:transposase
MFLTIGEMYTSKRCFNCHCDLVNMKAVHTRVRPATRFGPASVTSKMTRIHKILHCKSRQAGPNGGCCGTTWNRDVNAAKNMLMLLMHFINGFQRPAAFCSGKGSVPYVGTVI